MFGFMIKKQPDVPVAKPRRRPVDIKAGHKRAAERFPQIIARLGE